MTRTKSTDVKYSVNYNPIIEYWMLIEKGEEVVSQKIKILYRKLVRDINNPDEFFYSNKRANHVLEFAENYCRHSKGKQGGKRVVLELWEKAHLAAIFGFIDINGNRKYRQSLLIVGKKNGKSLLASIVGLYLMVADNEPGAEIYSVATKKDQAKIIWGESKRMVKKSPTLKQAIKPLIAEMNADFNDAVFKPLASDSNTLDGLNVHGGLMDEIHQWKNGRALYDIIADGTTAREQPLIYITSTAGTIREDIYDQLYEESERLINGYEDPEGYKDERFIVFIYEIDSRKEWVDETCWKKANPGLGTIKNLEQLKAKVNKAMQNPMLVKNLVCKEFNIRETSSESWLSFEDLNNTATFDVTELKPRYGIGGTDLSSTTDLTSAKVIFKVRDKEEIFVLSMYWIPADLVDKKVREDKIPYDKWIDLGICRTCPENKVHPKYVTEWFQEIQRDYDLYLMNVGYDAWSAAYWVEEMESIFGKIMVPVRQGKQTLSQPMKSLGADICAKLINYNNNPIDKWCLANTAYDEDKNGNIQPCKTSKSTKRIDGFASLLDAYVIYQDKKNEYESLI